MVIKQDNFQALCINNKYDDFGSHTGFKWVNKTLNHLKIGEWYNFRNRNGSLDVEVDGKYSSCTGHTFSSTNTIPIYNFYHFFSTIEEQRDMKLNSILK